jgi:hypothetical protein
MASRRRCLSYDGWIVVLVFHLGVPLSPWLPSNGWGGGGTSYYYYQATALAVTRRSAAATTRTGGWTPRPLPPRRQRRCSSFFFGAQEDINDDENNDIVSTDLVVVPNTNTTTTKNTTQAQQRRTWRWRAVTTRTKDYFIPDLPFQDTSALSWQDHFRPRFILREAIWGVRLMMRLYCALSVMGLLFEYSSPLVVLPIIPPIIVEPSFLENQGILHLIEQCAKQSLSTTFWLLFQSPLVLFTFTIPLLEECSYRGIGYLHSLGSRWVFYFVLTWLLAKSSPVVAGAFVGWDIFMNRGGFQLIVMPAALLVGVLGGGGMHRGPVLPLLQFTLQQVVPILLELPLQIRLFQCATAARTAPGARRRQRRKKDDPSKPPPAAATTTTVATDDGPAEEDIPETYRRLCERVIDRVLVPQGTVEPATAPAPRTIGTRQQLTGQLYRVLSRHARFQTSLAFGYAHVVVAAGAGMVSNVQQQYRYLQKFVGVMVSSWWVESRLVTRRGTLWGACAAHMTLNAMALCRMSIQEVLPPIGVVPRVALFPFVVIVVQVVLDRIAEILKRYQDRLDVAAIPS